MQKVFLGIPLFAFMYLFFRFGVDPQLLYQAQEPPYLFGTQFLSNFLHYPGGLSWYLSALLTQLYIFPWIGSAILTLFMVGMYWQTISFFKGIGKTKIPVIAVAAPALTLFIAYLNYTIPLTYAIQLLIAIVLFNLYKSLSHRTAFLKLPIYFVATILAYYTAGFAVILLGILCALEEILFNKKYLHALVMLAFLALLPLIAAQLFFVLLIPSAYYDVLGIKTYLLDAATYPRMPFLFYAIACYFTITIILSSINFQHFNKTPIKSGKDKHSFLSRLTSHNIMFIMHGIAIAMILMFSCFLFFDKKAKANYKIDYFAQNRLWPTIIQTITPANINNYSVVSQTQLFRALFYENKLLSDLFSYPQGMVGLSFEMTTTTLSKHFPLLMCDLCLDAGAINQAEYWALEALTMQGKKPSILKKLSLIHILKGQKETASKYLGMLNTSLFCKDFTNKYMPLGKNDTLIETDEYLKNIRSLATKQDYICKTFYDEMTEVLAYNAKNRFALEYLMTNNLLNNAVTPILDNIARFSATQYYRLPRHIQEALVFQLMLSNANTSTVGNYQIDTYLFSQFSDFTQKLSEYGSDRATGLKNTFGLYGNTYWYYIASNGRPVKLKKND